MPQAVPFGSPNDPQRRILYVHNGIEFIKVPGRIIEPYNPPVPQMELNEHKIIGGPSHLHQTGPSSYTCDISLLFSSKSDYHMYMRYIDNLHKFIDERGNLFLGAVSSIKSSAHEGLTKYKLELGFLFEKKNSWEIKKQIYFQDIEGLAEETDILEMANLGLVATRYYDGEAVLYFSPLDYLSRAECTMILNNTRKWIERIVRK